MTSPRLLRHYEEKYAGDSAGGAVEMTSAPRNRFEACVYYMTRNFKGGSILEIGGGEGTIARSLAGLPFTRYTITDLSTARASAAVASLDDPRFDGFALDVEGDLGELKYHRYQAVIMVALIEHLVDPIGALVALKSMLAEDGFVYIDTPNLAKFTRRVKLMLGQFPSTASTDEGLTTYGGGPVDLYDEGHLHYFTFRSLSEMLKRYCGFTRVEKTPYWGGPALLPARAAHFVAQAWPTMFSELAVTARP